MPIENDRRNIEQIALDAGIDVTELNVRNIDRASDSVLVRMRDARPALFDAFMEKHGATIEEIGPARVEQALTVAFLDGYYLLMVNRGRIDELRKHGALPGDTLEGAAMHLLESCFERDPSLLDHTIAMAKRELQVSALAAWKVSLGKVADAWADEKLGKEDEVPASTKTSRKNGRHTGHDERGTVLVTIEVNRDELIERVAAVLHVSEDDVAACLKRHKYFESLKGGQTTAPATLVSVIEKAILVMGHGYGKHLAQRGTALFINSAEAAAFDNCFDAVWREIARMPEVERNANGTSDQAEAERRKRAEVHRVLEKWNSGTRSGLPADRQSIQSFADLMTDVVELRRGIARVPRMDLLLPSDPYVHRSPYLAPSPLRDLRTDLAGLYREYSTATERIPLTSIGIDKVWIYGARLDGASQTSLREAFPEIRRGNWKFQEQHFINPSDIPKNPQPGLLGIWIPVFGGHTELEHFEGPIRKTPGAHFLRVKGRNATILENRIREFAESLI